MLQRILKIVLDTPLHRVFDYAWQGDVLPLVGQLVQVEFGSRKVAGMIVEIALASEVPVDKLKTVSAIRSALRQADLLSCFR